MSDDINKLRADYKDLTGKNAFNGWDAEELQKRINEALTGGEEPKKPAGPTVAVMIKRDIWDAEGNRHRKGTIIDMPIENAMDAVESGSVTRVKG